MVRRVLPLLVLMAVGSATLGCYKVRYSYDGPKHLTTAPALPQETRVVERFDVHDRQFYLLFGLIPLGGRVNGAELAAAQVGEYHGAVNLKLADGQDLLDLVLSNGPCLLYLLCGSWSVWAQGDVVELVEVPFAPAADPPVELVPASLDEVAADAPASDEPFVSLEALEPPADAVAEESP